jgi:hypothetical protein
MTTITTIRYVAGNSLDDLATKVNALLPTWQPDGDPFIPAYLSAPAQYVQKMVSTGVTTLAQLFNSGALAIKAGGSALAKSVNTVYGTIGASLVTKAAADMAALSGSVTTTKYNVFVFTLAADGTLATTMGTEGATLATVVFPTIPASTIVLGFVVIHPTGTGPFVGGTTPLDDATVVPNAVYVNTVGVFLPPA